MQGCRVSDWVSREQFGYSRDNRVPSVFHNRSALRPFGAAHQVGMVPAIEQRVRLEVYWSGHCVHAAWFMSDAIRVGAHPSNDLVLEGDGISHCHAVIHRSPDGDGYIIIGESDVRLNGIPISRAKLRQGDRLKIGSYEVLIRSEQVLFETQPVFLLTKKKAV